MAKDFIIEQAPKVTKISNQQCFQTHLFLNHTIENMKQLIIKSVTVKDAVSLLLELYGEEFAFFIISAVSDTFEVPQSEIRKLF